MGLWGHTMRNWELNWMKPRRSCFMSRIFWIRSKILRGLLSFRWQKKVTRKKVVKSKFKKGKETNLMLRENNSKRKRQIKCKRRRIRIHSWWNMIGSRAFLVTMKWNNTIRGKNSGSIALTKRTMSTGKKTNLIKTLKMTIIIEIHEVRKWPTM